MAETIYIVTGHTGEYSDSRDWTVCAYRDEAHAANHAKAAQDWARANAKEFSDRYWQRGRELKNPHDPDCQIDYTGTKYGVERVEVRESFQP